MDKRYIDALKKIHTDLHEQDAEMSKESIDKPDGWDEMWFFRRKVLDLITSNAPARLTTGK